MSRWIRSGVALAAAVPLAACTPDSGSTSLPVDGAPAETSAAPGATATAAAPSGQVLAAYLRYWDAVIAAHSKGDPRSAGLARVAVDPELSKIRAAVDRNRLQQVGLRGQVVHDPSVRQVAGDTATVEDCYDISDWDPVNLKTGAAIDVTEEGGTGRYKARYTLRRSGSSWLVTTDAPLGGC